MAIAQAFQIEGYRADTAAGLAEAVQAALAAGRPALIEVLIDPVSYPTSPWSVAQMAKG